MLTLESQVVKIERYFRERGLLKIQANAREGASDSTQGFLSDAYPTAIVSSAI